MATTLNNLTIKKLPAFNYANQNTDVDWSAESSQYSDYGEAVLEMMGLSRDSEPYILIIGAGDYYLYENDPSMRNQVFFAAYVPEKGADALFYIDGNWYKTYPWDTYADNPQHKVMVGNTEKLPGDTEQMRHTNRAYIDGERVFIQLYVISNNTPYDTASSNFWNAADGLKGHSQTV